MVRIAGLTASSSKGKKRLHPSATTVEGRREQHPLFQYAVDEYSQAVPPGTSNDDGNSILSIAGSSVSNRRNTNATQSSGSTTIDPMQQQQQQQQPQQPPIRISNAAPHHHNIDHYNENRHHHQQQQQQQQQIPELSNYDDIPEATYEEAYGEAYTGGPMKYIYPSGYQTMRPRSCPWKLSIVVCLLFTWLSVFIVGHCSDQVADVTDYTYDDAIDDDSLVIDIRWCGSRPLYLMWVASMLITGLSAAYCGVIGYIKVRDFAVANSRSQLGGCAEAKSDYYVKIGRNIYQSDGAPQFWGSHIYKPTQAAVAVTSR